MGRSFFFVLAFAIFILTPVSAMQISFSSLNLAPNTYLIYNSSGSLIDEIKSNETITLNGTEDYIIISKPEKVNLLNDPYATLKLIPDYAPTFFNLALLLGVAALLLGFIRILFRKTGGLY